ncbi:DNA alkylation repair protein [Amycolatopsis rhabdoformis]|uniref:DNA alkylation repair protein n=1 Tax=Amycolatopsis rhabdoformis TaxID=1448059 RepID=A0ABZ1HXB6_9PSEU|nr:DNA alkylation repair protein [Amycolatopsis rhabdoformis]WSE26600.1 DNA alkylation repair protein [Amycolatopsis rhabdoformis]
MPLADEMLNDAAVKGLLKALKVAAPGVAFGELRRVRLGGLGLRQRTDAVRDAVLADLPGGYRELADVVHTALADESFSGWMIWPVSEAASVRALEDGGPAAFDAALDLLALLTPRLTAEFAIRQLLEADLDRALPKVLAWTTDPSEHVRRLASEGTRPLLPWARRVPAISARPGVTVPILDALHRDESAYVRRSVANHLNDVSRARPEVVVAAAGRWLSASADKQTAQLVRHGLRTLVKQGDPGALTLLGFAPPDGITFEGPLLSVPTVSVGGELSFTGILRNTGESAQNLVVDYVVHHRKANGTTTPKVFKLTTRTLEPGGELRLDRTHSFRLITTRVYHPGAHALEIQVNGTSLGKADFELLG